MRDNRAVGRETEEALGHSVDHALTNSTQVTVVPRTFVGVALVAESLEVREVVSASVTPRDDVVYLKRPLLC